MAYIHRLDGSTAIHYIAQIIPSPSPLEHAYLTPPTTDDVDMQRLPALWYLPTQSSHIDIANAILQSR
jgi:hypothetical protein